MAEEAELRWGDRSDDGDGDGDHEYLKFLLPPKQVIGPDENGIKKVIEYKFGEDGSKLKVTTTMRVRKIANTRLSKRVAERRSWPKFGDAVHDDADSRLTTVSTEEIFFELSSAPGTSEDPLAQMGKGSATLMGCRTCGKKGDHWTAQCPYKDILQPSGSFTDKPAPSETNAAVGVVTKVAYVPPSKRGGTSASERSGAAMKKRNHAVRVNNLSEDTREDDLRELVQTIGPVSRVCVVLHQDTGNSKRYGFVHFVNKEDAERAINKLNGYGYDSLILRVEWADRDKN